RSAFTFAPRAFWVSSTSSGVRLAAMRKALAEATRSPAVSAASAWRANFRDSLALAPATRSSYRRLSAVIASAVGIGAGAPGVRDSPGVDAFAARMGCDDAGD